MTYYGGKEMAASLRTVRANTITIAEEIPEEKYSFKPTPESRSIAQLLTHIAVGSGYQLYMHQNRITDLKLVNFPQLMQAAAAEEAKPRTKAEIIELLRSRGEEFASFLEGLGDDVLAERVAMPPGAQPATKSRMEMLLSPKEHEMHHRGQLMLIERMLGIVPHLTRAAAERMAARAAAPAQA
jgi:uncharacterized damage-inducible protein DinB